MITLENNPYRGIRGFNYQPSYGANGVLIWNAFDVAKIEAEVACSRHFFPKANTLRIWLSFDAYILNSKGFCENFERYLSILEKYQYKAIPVLFNNWHGIPDFGGISEEMIRYWFRDIGKKGTAPDYIFLNYLTQIVGAHSQDTRILIWDLCNEPSNNGSPEIIGEWLSHTYRFCKQLNARQSIGISECILPLGLKRLENASDVLLIHPYFANDKIMDAIIKLANKYHKPVLTTECCWGYLDDTQRVTRIQSELALNVKYQLGFLPHLLHETRVADGHRPDWGVVSSAGYMAFIHRDGTIRPGHDIYNTF